MQEIASVSNSSYILGIIALFSFMTGFVLLSEYINNKKEEIFYRKDFYIDKKQMIADKTYPFFDSWETK